MEHTINVRTSEIPVGFRFSIHNVFNLETVQNNCSYDVIRKRNSVVVCVCVLARCQKTNEQEKNVRKYAMFMQDLNSLMH